MNLILYMTKLLKTLALMKYLFITRKIPPKVSRFKREKPKRKLIWFNPPYFNTIKTNVGKFSLKLVKQHFPKGHKLHKIFNKNTINISYSYMKKTGSVLSRHNKNILYRKEDRYGMDVIVETRLNVL